MIVDETITSNRSGAGGNGEDDGGDGGRGGAIWTSGSLQVTNSTLSDNRTGPGGQDQVGFETNGVPGKGGAGGAIWCSGPLLIINSTFSDNSTAAGRAGANPGDNGSNCGRGGAIRIAWAATIRRSTFAENSTRPGGSGYGGEGSGGSGGAGRAISSSGHNENEQLDLRRQRHRCGWHRRRWPLSGRPIVGIGGRGGAISSSAARRSPTRPSLTTARGSAATAAAAKTGTPTAALAATAARSRPPWSALPSLTRSLRRNAAGAGGRGSNRGSPGVGPNCSGSIVDDGHNLAFPARGGCPATFTQATRCSTPSI